MSLPLTDAPAPDPAQERHAPRKAPIATVVICTRNRPEGLERTLGTMLANPFPSFEVVVVDQSTDGRTAAVVGDTTDERVRYVPQDARGLARARNEGVRQARGRYILFTDDDCTVPEGWIAGMVRRFESESWPAGVYGRLDAIPHDWTAEYIPQFRVERSRLIRGQRAATSFSGYGANFGFRRDALLRLGLFDEQLGAGAPLRSAEDSDIGRRALREGETIAVVASPAVLHWGARSLLDGSGQQLIRDGLYAEGARIARELRLLNPYAMLELAHITRWEVTPAVGSLLSRRRPTGLRRITACYAGLATGMRLPLDRNRGLFRS